MHNTPALDAALDMEQTGRDELIDGSCPVVVAPQSEASDKPIEPTAPQRCDTQQRELIGQFQVLSHAIGPKPR